MVSNRETGTQTAREDCFKAWVWDKSAYVWFCSWSQAR